jgi:hypothetical protein
VTKDDGINKLNVRGQVEKGFPSNEMSRASHTYDDYLHLQCKIFQHVSVLTACPFSFDQPALQFILNFLG